MSGDGASAEVSRRRGAEGVGAELAVNLLRESYLQNCFRTATRSS